MNELMTKTREKATKDCHNHLIQYFSTAVPTKFSGILKIKVPRYNITMINFSLDFPSVLISYDILDDVCCCGEAKCLMVVLMIIEQQECGWQESVKVRREVRVG